MPSLGVAAGAGLNGTIISILDRSYYFLKVIFSKKFYSLLNPLTFQFKKKNLCEKLEKKLFAYIGY